MAGRSSASQIGGVQHEPPPRDPPRPSASGAAQSTRERAARRGWRRSSTASTPSVRPARPTSPANAPRAGCWSRTLRRRRHIRRDARAPGAEAPARRHRGRTGRHRGRLQDRSAVPLADGLRQAGRDVRRAQRHVRSVTQTFNTTTSMGRLTLNILLTFAQFERDVIGERIRDKIAASRRGMWMGAGCRSATTCRAQAGGQRGRGRAGPHDLRALRRIGSATKLVPELEPMAPQEAGRPIDKGDLYRMPQQPSLPRRGGPQGHGLSRRADAIVPQDLWDRVHASWLRRPQGSRAPGRRRRRCCAG